MSDNTTVQQAADLMWDHECGPTYHAHCLQLAETLAAAGLLADPTPAHESDQSRYASECDLCETDGTLHMWTCPNHPRHSAVPTPALTSELLAALKEAREDVEEWGAYASDYFQQKWDLAGSLARIDGVIAAAVDRLAAATNRNVSGRYTAARPLAAEGARVGLITCTDCGSALLVDPADDFNVLVLHDDWHTARPTLSEDA